MPQKHAPRTAATDVGTGAQVVDPHYAKSGEYRQVLDEIAGGGQCPFCPDNFRWHKQPVLHQIGGWIITKNSWPYPNTAHHLLLIGQRHRERFEDLTATDWTAIRGLINWAIAEFNLPGGGIAMRFGETSHTGATVVHFHVHLIVPELDSATGRAKLVNFPVG